MGALNTIRNILGPSQTDHKRLAEIKLTQERLNKPIEAPRKIQLKLPSAYKTFEGGAMDMIGGMNVVKGFSTLSKASQRLYKLLSNAPQEKILKRK
jgi:hypothetical protein